MIKYEFLDNVSEKQEKRKKQELDALLFSLPFIFADNTTVNIIECSNERPDLKIQIQDDSDIIGIEHTQCYPTCNDDLGEAKTSYRKICTPIIEKIKKSSLFADMGGKAPNHFVIKIYHEKLFCRISKLDKNRIYKEITMLINNKAKKESRCSTNIISDISFWYDKDTSDIEISIDIESNMTYLVSQIANLNPNPIIERIKKKELLLAEYKQNPANSNVNKWWLMIQIPRFSYLNPLSYELPEDFSSNYDKIILVKDSGLGIGTYILYDKSIEYK